MIYLDHAATTRTAPEVVEAMLPYFSQNYGNCGGVYKLGSMSKRAVIEAKKTIADTLHAQANEIYFTSGGTEADNWALKAIFESKSGQGNHIITSKAEHHAILHTCEYLEKHGARVTYLDVDEHGMISLEKLKRAICDKTILISIMFANNEVGSIQPVKEIGELAKEKGILFHTDAVQAYGHIPINVEELHIDLLSASGHKFYGPKGIGFLYASGNTGIVSFMHGGGQERGRRAGTENVPGIVGIAKAAEMAAKKSQETAAKETELRDYMIGELEKKIAGAKLNGHRTKRLPGNVHFVFENVEGEALLLMLDSQGICASGGSACTTGEGPSHVLRAIGLTEALSRGALRITIGEENTKEEIDEAVNAIAGIVEQLRGVRY